MLVPHFVYSDNAHVYYSDKAILESWLVFSS